MKKLYLIFGLLFLVVAGLSGCANKNNSVPLHSVKYYTKHQKQMTAMLNECQKLPTPHSENQATKLLKSNLGEDCGNASSAQIWLEQNSANKSLGSATGAAW